MEKRKMKLVSVGMGMILSLALMAGCGKKEEEAAAEPAQEQQAEVPDKEAEVPAEKLKIGCSWYCMTDEHLSRIYNEVESYVAENGLEDEVELILLDAGFDSAKQNEQVDNLIAQEVDAILIIPNDREQQVPAIEAAVGAGIPIIEVCASTAATETRTSYVGSDDTYSGKLLMEELAKRAEGKGNIVVIHGPAGQNAEVMRHLGMQEVLEDYPDMQVVAEKVCDWDRAKAMAAMENIIQSGMDVDVVFAEDDGMAAGALEAIAGSSLEDEIIVGGIDGIPDAILAVEEGRMACTVFQNAKEQGNKAIQVAIEAAKGNEIEKLYSIPYELITQDNVDHYKELLGM